MFNALWAFDGSSVKIWMNFLLYNNPEEDFRWIHTIDDAPLSMSFDFHPLSRQDFVVATRFRLKTRFQVSCLQRELLLA
jgi:hypothetical protein